MCDLETVMKAPYQIVPPNTLHRTHGKILYSSTARKIETPFYVTLATSLLFNIMCLIIIKQYLYAIKLSFQHNFNSKG